MQVNDCNLPFLFLLLLLFKKFMDNKNYYIRPLRWVESTNFVKPFKSLQKNFLISRVRQRLTVPTFFQLYLQILDF